MTGPRHDAVATMEPRPPRRVWFVPQSGCLPLQKAFDLGSGEWRALAGDVAHLR